MHRVKDHGDKVGSGQELYESESQKYERNLKNGFLQFNEVVRLIDRSKGELRLTRRKISRLHFCAIEGIYTCAGLFRTWPVRINGSSHSPPEDRYVEGLVADMCATANGNKDWSPIKTSAYLLWRLNWIHPFGGGNGRTSRAVAYFALCVRLGFKLPGKLAISAYIDRNRKRYQDALEDADAACKQDITNVTKLESLLDDFLTEKLAYLDET